MWNKLIWKFTTIRQLFSVWNNQNFLVKYRNFVQRRLSFVMWRHDFNRAFVVIWNICQGWPIALPTSLSLSVWRQSQWLHNLQQRERKTALILIMLPFLLLRSWWHAIFALRIFLSFFSFSFFSIHPFFYLLPGQFLAPGFSSSCDARCQRTEPRRRRRLERESSKRGMFLSLLLCIANANMRKLKLFGSISICLGMQKMEKGNKIDMADFNLFWITHSKQPKPWICADDIACLVFVII